MSRAFHRPFRGLRPPAAPADLRRRALAAAHAVPVAASGKAPRDRRNLTDRLWESRPLRLAWVLVFFLLLGANAYLDTRGRNAPQPHVEAARGRTTLIDARALMLRAMLDAPETPATARGGRRSS